MLKILVATDGSPGAEGAREFLCALPLPPGTEIHVVSVMVDPVLPALPSDPTALANVEVLAITLVP